ncbi:MAG TPA: VIT1/CCC1 transporter family protein [Burkholderiales bacterium]|nr:VIT1/CCC1 transporter family protein [Burkholderiales bacterium]
MAQSGEEWLDETRSAYLYRVIAEVERGTPRADLFEKLAHEAEGQAAIWARNTGLASVPAFVPDLRTRIVAGLLRRYGARAMRGILAAMKVRGLSVYSHAAPGHPAPTSVEEVGKRHRGIAGGGNLRAAVFGINDGLVSNLSLILGVAGASSNAGFILLSGVAGLLAGAFSMAAGEYVSVRSQREMYEHQIGLERAELAEYPEEEAEELALIYAARGMSVRDAHDLAGRTIADPRLALDTLAREELGLNPEALGSPWGAALSSFFSFGAGALVPLLPFLFVRAEGALIAAMALTAVALFGVGAMISLFTGRSAFRDGFRMLAIGGGAGAVTYFVGKLLGVSLS